MYNKTTRIQETPRQVQNPMVQAHDERAHTVPEETLAKILKGRRYVDMCRHFYACVYLCIVYVDI